MLCAGHVSCTSQQEEMDEYEELMNPILWEN
jgi:hypothetical protein